LPYQYPPWIPRSLEVVPVTQVTTAVQLDTGGPDSSKFEEEDVDQLDVGMPDEDKAPAPVSRQMAIDAIVAEVHCSTELAASTIDWIDDLVEQSRADGYFYAWPSTAQMQSAEYDVFDEMWPHAATPALGTAGHAVSKHLLRGNETGIYHDLVRNGERSHCGVRVLVGSV
jgi:hypothetical protein